MRSAGADIICLLVSPKRRNENKSRNNFGTALEAPPFVTDALDDVEPCGVKRCFDLLTMKLHRGQSAPAALIEAFKPLPEQQFLFR